MSGCPFASAGRGENPHQKTVSGEDIDFESIEESYPLPITSPYSSQVQLYRRDQFPSKSEFQLSRSHFLSLSPHLQNTLFHPKHIRKLRGRETMEKFVIFADLKSAGNVEYRKGDYSRALSIHEQIYGLFRYLELTRDAEEGLNFSVTDSDYEYRCCSASSPEEDKLLRDMVSTTLLNMAACALKLGGLPDARRMSTEAAEVQPEYALCYARRAQSVIANLESTVRELEAAVEDAERAARLDPRKEFKALACRGRERVASEEEKEQSFFAKFFESVKKFGWVEAAPPCDELELEHLIIKKMYEKYQEMLRFYEECEKPDKLLAVRQEMQVVAGVLRRMDWIQRISVENPPRVMQEEALRAEVDLSDKRVASVVDCVKRMNISSAFSGPKYNDQLLKYCIDLCTAEGLRRQREAQMAAGKTQSSSCGCLAVAVAVGLVAWAWFYWGRASNRG